jgi:hypothetical protein
MALQLSYHQNTYTPTDDFIPGNSTASNPVRFELAPAEGADLARMKSILVAVAGLVADGWAAGDQAAVIRAFETGAPAFVNTVERVHGLSVPVAMAKRVGLPVQDGQTDVPVVTGYDFSKVCGFSEMMTLTMQLAAEILKLSNKLQVDPRFFAQPSGSLPPVTAGPVTGTSATPAPQQSEGGATADGTTQAGSRPRTTSRRKS